MSSKNSGESSDSDGRSEAIIEEDRIHENKMRAYFATREGKRTMAEMRTKMAWVVSLSQAEFVAENPECGRFFLGLFPRIWQILLKAGLEPEDTV